MFSINIFLEASIYHEMFWFLQFLFIEGADLPAFGDKPFKLKETIRSLSPSGATITTTKTVFKKPGSGKILNGFLNIKYHNIE